MSRVHVLDIVCSVRLCSLLCQVSECRILFLVTHVAVTLQESARLQFGMGDRAGALVKMHITRESRLDIGH